MRRSERIQVELPVIWTRGVRRIACTAADINLHGMFIRTDETIEPGSLMQVEITLPERPIALFGTSRFVGRTLAGDGVGVEIFMIDDDSRALWVAHYHAMSATEAKPSERLWTPSSNHREASSTLT